MSHSPLQANTSRSYEQGWNAINELIRSDGSWSGYERNIFYVNHRDGTFSDVSGTVGLDFAEDGRAFALSDTDHDGRLEVVLKNRNGPQLRILRNEMREIGECIAFRLRGHQGNRDAIGAAVTVETEKGRQVKYLQAGSGFLSQHTKELFFGLGHSSAPLRATVRWPNGLIQHFENLPSGHRMEIEEGSDRFRAEPFLSGSAGVSPAHERPTAAKMAALPAASETWLIAPLAAPDFSLPDLMGRVHTLAAFRGRKVLLNFWATWCPPCRKELQVLEQYKSRWTAQGLQVVTVNVNNSGEAETVRTFAKGLSFVILLASEDVAGIYNILYRYLFDRRRDLGIPTSLLIDDEGSIVKIYQGPLDPEHVLADLDSVPRNAEERVKRALPFSGTYYGGSSQRNHFTYGVAFFQRGYLDQAVVSFRLAIQDNPEYADAYYNLGTLYMKKEMRAEARQSFERALQLRPDYPDALNNLGLLAAQEGHADEAISYFQRAVEKNPEYVIGLQNLGNLYREQGRWAESQRALERALYIAPEDPELNYSLGMLFARQDDTGRASEYLHKAVKLRPDYPEALNNLGVLYLRTGKREQATAAFEECIRMAPTFDQGYLNLAKVYVAAGERQKAQQILRQLLERHPDHSLARSALEQLTR